MATRITYPNKVTGNTYLATEATEVKTVVNSHADDIESLQITNQATTLAVKFDKKVFPTSHRTQSGVLTYTIDSTGAVNGGGQVDIVDCDGSNIVFQGAFTNFLSINTQSGQTLVIVFVWNSSLSECMLSVDPAPGSSSSTYSFVNTHAMVASSIGDGMSILNPDCYPSDGAGTDEAFTVEVWGTLNNPHSATGQLFELIDDNDDSIIFQCQITSGELIGMFINTDASNRISRRADLPLLVDNTKYQIVITFDTTTIKIYINGTEATSYTDTSTGSYAGMPALVGNAKLNFPGITLGVQPDMQKYELYRQFSSALSAGEITTLYNAGVAVGLNTSLQSKCVQENLLNNNYNADNIGVNGSQVGSSSFIAL